MSARQLEARWSTRSSCQARVEAHHTDLQDEALWYYAACGPLAGLRSRFPPLSGRFRTFSKYRAKTPPFSRRFSQIMTGDRPACAGMTGLSCAAPLAAGKECRSNETRPPTAVRRPQIAIHPSILHLVSVFQKNNARLRTAKHKASTPRHTSRSSRGKRLCGSTRFMLHALAFNDLRQECAPGGWHPYCITGWRICSEE